MEINFMGRRRRPSSQNRNGGGRGGWSLIKRKEKGVRVGVDYTSSGFLKMKKEMGLAKKSQNRKT